MGNRRSGHPGKRAWVPLRRTEVNPELVRRMQAVGQEAGLLGMEAWGNDLYDAVVRHYESGITHISFKRLDRAAIRSWRHMQQMKNEICGPQREACEIFPAEGRLVDTANEYHLWVLPEGAVFPFGYGSGLVSTDEQVDHFNAQREAGMHKGRQDPWQEGLTTGRNEHNVTLDDLTERMDAAQAGAEVGR